MAKVKKVKPEKDKKQGFFSSKNLMGMFIVMIMVLSGAGLYYGSSDDGATDTYNGYDLVSDQGYWYLVKANKAIRLQYHPSQVDYINISAPAMSFLNQSKMIYLTFDPDDKYIEQLEVIRMELEREVPKGRAMYVITGVSDNSGEYSMLPQIDCDNATTYIPVIYFSSSDRTYIDDETICMGFYAGSASDVYKLKDRLLYGILGVI